jgi:hypothetical protein
MGLIETLGKPETLSIPAVAGLLASAKVPESRLSLSGVTSGAHDLLALDFNRLVIALAPLFISTARLETRIACPPSAQRRSSLGAR